MSTTATPLSTFFNACFSSDTTPLSLEMDIFGIPLFVGKHGVQFICIRQSRAEIKTRVLRNWKHI